MKNLAHLHRELCRLALPRLGRSPAACLSLALSMVLTTGTAVRAEPIVEQKIIGNSVAPSDHFGRAVGTAAARPLSGRRPRAPSA